METKSILYEPYSTVEIIEFVFYHLLLILLGIYLYKKYKEIDWDNDTITLFFKVKKKRFHKMKKQWKKELDE